MYHTE